MENSKLNSIEALTILVKWRKLIVINFLAFSIVAAIVSLILPKWYTARSSILPPEQQSLAGLGFLSVLEEMPLNMPSLPGVAGPADLYVAILRSRNVREAVIRDLDLKRVFKAKTMEDALRKLDKLTKIDKTEENVIVIKTTARTKKLAAEMGRAYLKHLDRVNRTARTTSARYTREFIEKRLQQAENDLRKAAQALRDFQKEHRVVSVEEQTKAAITALADVESEIALAEVAYNVARRNYSETHPTTRQLAFKLEELQKQAEKIETGAGLDKDKFVVPLEEFPDLALQYAFLLRDVEVQKAIYKLLAQQYEQAKIQEARDTPTIQVLDEPVEPEKKSKPKRVITVVVAAILSVFVSLFIIFVMEHVQRLEVTDPEAHRKLMTAVATVKSDVQALLPRRRKARAQ